MIIQVFEELKMLIRTSELPLRYIAYRSGVDRLTLKHWLNGRTSCPRIDTMVRVATVLGHHIGLTSSVSKMVRAYPLKRPINPPPVIRPNFEQWRLQ